MASYSGDMVSKFNFTAKPDSALQCVICLDVAEDPRQHEECGRLLCKECLEKYGRDKLCPNCKREQPQYFKDNRSNREISALCVKCSNTNRGPCEWVGTVGTLEEHVATCGFTLVPCPKQCKDDNNQVKCLLKKDLGEHMMADCPNRGHECQHCGKKGSYAFITKVHDDSCMKKIVPCPNAGCGDIMERQQVCTHVHAKCLHTVLPCKYKGIGCDTELKREDIAEHEQDDKLHLHMALETVNKQQVAINSIGSLRATVESMQENVDSLYAMLRNREIELKMKQKQEREMLHKALETVNSQQSALEVTVKSLLINVELREEVLKNKESKTFRLLDYKKKKETDEVSQFQPFYTHPNGYHMAMRVYANGDSYGKGTHVSVYAAIVKGEYDAGLKWPFVGKVTVTLLNQLQNRKHCTVVIPFSIDDNKNVNGTLGFPTYITHSALAYNPVKKTQYLKDDTLYFRVAVEVADHRLWLE